MKTLWCEPDQINPTVVAGHRHEQWVYDNAPVRGVAMPRGYLYFENGRLTAIQDRRW